MNRTWAGIFLLVMVLSLAAYGRYSGAPVRTFEKVIDSRSGSPIRVQVFFPAKTDGFAEKSRPAVVAIPPYSIHPEAMEIICAELARRGAACAVPNFFGKTPEESRQHMDKESLNIMAEDVFTIVQYLRSLPWVDPRKIGACGHSVGGTVTTLVGIRDPNLAAAVPIGMESMFLEKRPRNLLFLSGLYDEIHSPKALLENLKEHEVTDNPQLDQLYGSFEKNNARQVTVIPTTDHFIETFDYLLIKKLLDWYARAFNAPELGAGPLEEWFKRVSQFFLAFSLTALYAMAYGAFAKRMARRMAAFKPSWLILRITALPAVPCLIAAYLLGFHFPEHRSLAMDLMISLILGQEVAVTMARGELTHPGRSPFRAWRSALFILAALGVGTLLSFGIVTAPDFFRYEGTIKWYPVFFANMTFLFPIEVWGRAKPFLFAEYIGGFKPDLLYFALAAFAMLFPGHLLWLFEIVLRELTLTVRRGLKPLAPKGMAAIPLKEEKNSQTIDKKAPGAPFSPVKLSVLALLFIILIFFGAKRIREGMLTLETFWLVVVSLTRFAVLPFIITWLIVRTRGFRKISLLD